MSLSPREMVEKSSSHVGRKITLPWILIDGQVIELKMDTETLSAQFQRAQGKPINYCGNTVLQIFKKDLNQELVSLAITRHSSLRKPEQGIRIKVEKAEINLEGNKYKEIILWGDNSPDSVEIAVTCKGKSQLKIWNVWRVDALVNAWVGNAGMVISIDVKYDLSSIRPNEFRVLAKIDGKSVPFRFQQ